MRKSSETNSDSISPWCVKHDERILMTRELDVEGLVGELENVLFVGEYAEQQQRQNCQARSQHSRNDGSFTHGYNYCQSVFPALAVRYIPSAQTWPFYSMRRRRAAIRGAASKVLSHADWLADSHQ